MQSFCSSPEYRTRKYIRCLGSNHLEERPHCTIVTDVQWIAAIVDLLQLKWISPYLRYPTSKMAEIWPPGIFFQYICTCKVSASYLLYLRSSINEIIQNYSISLDSLIQVCEFKRQEAETLHVQIYWKNMLGVQISAIQNVGYNRYREIHLSCRRSA